MMMANAFPKFAHILFCVACAYMTDAAASPRRSKLSRLATFLPLLAGPPSALLLREAVATGLPADVP